MCCVLTDELHCPAQEKESLRPSYANLVYGKALLCARLQGDIATVSLLTEEGQLQI